MLHCTALIEADIQHGRCAASGEHKRQRATPGMNDASLHGSTFPPPICAESPPASADDPAAGPGVGRSTELVLADSRLCRRKPDSATARQWSFFSRSLQAIP